MAHKRKLTDEQIVAVVKRLEAGRSQIQDLTCAVSRRVYTAEDTGFPVNLGDFFKFCEHAAN